MVEVYLWEGLYGHAALKIFGKNGGEDVYISFHPVEQSGKANKFHKLAWLSDIFGDGVDARMARDLDEDISAIGAWVRDIDDTVERPGQPTAIVRLEMLNETAIIAQWKRILKSKRKYKVIYNNCCTIVAQCLCMGHINGGITLTDKELQERMKNYRDEIIYIKYVFRGRHYQPVPLYRYTNDAILSPTAIKDANFASWMTAILAGTSTAVTAFTLPIFFPVLGASIMSAGVIMSQITSQFFRYMWVPRMIHNLALYMKEDELPIDELEALLKRQDEERQRWVDRHL